MPRNNSYDKPEYKEKQRLTHKEELNPNWLGGKRTHYFEKYSKLSLSLEQKCSLCGTITKLMCHHIDGDFRNNNLSNLMIVCRGCHNKIHKTKRLVQK